MSSSKVQTIDFSQKLFVQSLHKRLTKMEKIKKKNPYNTMERCKLVRSVYLILNKNKYAKYTFKENQKKFWATLCIRCDVLTNDIEEIIRKKEKMAKRKERNNKYCKDIENEIKYYKKTVKTIQKYDRNYGKKIGLVLNRAFCRNIALYIRNYI